MVHNFGVGILKYIDINSCLFNFSNRSIYFIQFLFDALQLR